MRLYSNYYACLKGLVNILHVGGILLLYKSSPMSIEIEVIKKKGGGGQVLFGCIDACEIATHPSIPNT